MAKTLPEHRVRAIKDFVRRIMQDDHGGSVSATAKALKMPQSQLSDLLNDRRGLGFVGIERVADYAHATLDEVVGRKTPTRKASGLDRRQAAADLAREDNVQEAAIQDVLAEEMHPEDTQRSTLWWARKMRQRDVEMEATGTPTATAVRRKKA